MAPAGHCIRWPIGASEYVKIIISGPEIVVSGDSYLWARDTKCGPEIVSLAQM